MITSLNASFCFFFKFVLDFRVTKLCALCCRLSTYMQNRRFPSPDCVYVVELNSSDDKRNSTAAAHLRCPPFLYDVFLNLHIYMRINAAEPLTPRAVRGMSRPLHVSWS